MARRGDRQDAGERRGERWASNYENGMGKAGKRGPLGPFSLRSTRLFDRERRRFDQRTAKSFTCAESSVISIQEATGGVMTRPAADS